MKDQAIEYKTSLYKVTRALERLKKTGLNVSKYENLVETIEKDCDKDISYDNVQLFSQNDGFAVGFLEQGYMKAIKKLEAIYLEISKYEIYLKIAAFIGVLRTFLEKENKSLEEIANIRSNLLNMLNDLKNSGTLDYNVEGELIEDIYHLTYEFIKIEQQIMGVSPTLLKLKMDDTHCYNLDREIIRELEKMNLKEPKYFMINARIHELEMGGLHTHYLDETLINLINQVDANLSTYEEKILELNAKLNYYIEIIKRTEAEIESDHKEIEENKKNKKVTRKKIGKNIVLFATSLGLSIGLLKGSWELSKTLANTTNYKVKTTTYNAATEELVMEENYKPQDTDTVFIHEYSPYVKIFGEFERKVITYDLSEVGDLPIKSYLDLDLEELGIKGKVEYEYKDSLSLEDLYQETYQELIKNSIDNENSRKEVDKDAMVFYFLLFMVLVLPFNAVIEMPFDCFGLKKEGDHWGSIQAIIDIMKNIKSILAENKNIQFQKEEIAKLTKEIKRILVENEDLINEMVKMLPLLERQPEYQQEVKKVEETIRLARKLK